MVVILFLIGFVLLIKGADFLVDGSVAVAQKYNVSSFIIGLTIVSFGTSLPEMIVNIMASFSGNADIAVGNVFGSNISNILLILGVSGIIYPLSIKRNIYLTEIPFSLVATLLVAYLANAHLFNDEVIPQLDRWDGVIILFFFGLFMAYVIYMTGDEVSEDVQEVKIEMKRAIIYILFGMVALYFGGQWVVEGAVHFAQMFELSESFIGLTVVSVGTSLPELVTSAVAAYKRNSDIAVGNVIGSNIFNMLWILGLSAVINPLPFNKVNNLDVFMVLLSTVMLILTVISGKQKQVNRLVGICFVVTYILFVGFLLLRE